MGCGETAKDVQDAIREGTATPELLHGEMQRLEDREARSRELDGEKVRLRIHEKVRGQLDGGAAGMELTDADRAAARLIVFQSLDYSDRGGGLPVVFPGTDAYDERYRALAEGLPGERLAFLIRMALSGMPGSKRPGSPEADCLEQVARAAGIDVDAIAAEQRQLAEKRAARTEARIEAIHKRIESLEGQPDTEG